MNCKHQIVSSRSTFCAKLEGDKFYFLVSQPAKLKSPQGSSDELVAVIRTGAGNRSTARDEVKHFGILELSAPWSGAFHFETYPTE